MTLTHHPGEALEWLASGLRFDAILSAVMMRYLTGPEFFVRARHIDRASSRRIVFHSGGVGGKEHEFLRSLPNRFVAKPADRTTLLAAIHDAAARGGDDEMT